MKKGGGAEETDRQTGRQTDRDRQKRSQADRWSETARERQGKKKLEKNKINFTFNVIILL